VQPDVLDRLHGIPEFRGRGLLARFLYALPVSLVGRRQEDASAMSARLQADYAQRIRALLDLPAAAEDEHGPSPRLVSVSPWAWDPFREFRRQLEAAMAPGAKLASLADWGSKLGGHVLRLAGLLVVADQVEAGDLGTRWADPVPLTIPGETMERAIALGEYFIAHARVAFQVMAEDPAFAAARRQLVWLVDRKTPLADFSRRTLYRDLHGTFPRVADLAPGLALLEEHGYIRERPKTRTVGRPSPGYLVNPHVYNSLGDRVKSAKISPPADTWGAGATETATFDTFDTIPLETLEPTAQAPEADHDLPGWVTGAEPDP
jgi:replicative DNA helicase